MKHCLGLVFVLTWFGACEVPAAEVKVLRRAADPYGAPRPAPDQKDVPLWTTFYVELGSTDPLRAESVTIELEPAGAKPLAILLADCRFPEGFTGRFFPGRGKPGEFTLAVYVDPTGALLPSTRYTMRVAARSQAGAVLGPKAGTWQFTTETAPAVHPLRVALSLADPAVRWRGSFFTGYCITTFCSGAKERIPTFELMQQVRQRAPRAWSLERDFWLTGMEHQPEFLGSTLPNIVRERETRRIVAITRDQDASVLQVEDFYGHSQYGIPSGRPLSADYHAADEILVADGVHDARAKVISVDDRQRTVRVSRIDPPAGSWRLAYASSPNTKENPDAPGLFPNGGCYLRKFRPCGTPMYYWGRLDKEWDLAHRRFGRRVVVNFADAPGDLALDGRNWTTAKDYVELHEAVRAITRHIIERYGEKALEFPWSVFNEPDLGALFWRASWDELQVFYDYTTDGILRAFEDKGLDSRRVFIGGLELGGIFGVHLRLQEFLAHCSPRAQAKGVRPLNAAYADARLDGKRSRRVEDLCRAHAGRGAPCDFISVHAYNASQMMAAKLIRAKEMALEIDPAYYAGLWVNSHEACPGWMPPPDPAYGDSYLGDGYFPTWSVDVARRLLQRAAGDPRYGFGESILTFWQAPPSNFSAGNDCVRSLQMAGPDGADRIVTVPMPILHFLGLLGQMGPEYRVLPEQTVAGHVVSGFASRINGTLRVVLYSHAGADTESRSEAAFDVTLELSGLPEGKTSVEEYRFDKDHNSYFRLGRRLRDEPPAKPLASSKLEGILGELRSKQPAAQKAALEELTRAGAAARPGTAAVWHFLQNATDTELRAAALKALQRINSAQTYPAEVVRQVEKLAKLQRTAQSTHLVAADGRLSIRVPVAANGANYLVIASSKP
jgi:hypothetical protein